LTVLYYNPNPHSGGSPCIDVYQPSVGKKRAVTYTFVMRVSMVACGTLGFFAADVAAPAGATDWDLSTLGMQFLFVNSTGYAMATDGPSCDSSAQSNVYSGVGNSSAPRSPTQASLVASPNGCDGTVDSDFSGTYNGESVECAPYFTSPTPQPNNTTIIIASVAGVLALLLICCLIALCLFLRRRRQSKGDSENVSAFRFVLPDKKNEAIVDPVQAFNKDDLDLWNEAKTSQPKTEPRLMWGPKPKSNAKARTGDVKVPLDVPEEPEFIIQTFHNEAVIGEDEEDEEEEEEEDDDYDDEDDEEEDEDEDEDDDEVPKHYLNISLIFFSV